MAQITALQGESWQQVVCRICAHRFAIPVEDAEGAAVALCQTCSILVEWFGQEAAAPIPAPPQPNKDKAPQKQANKGQRQERQRARLASALDLWGELWRSSEEQE
jgi:sugar (pentulose or hexulose) kinase